MFFKITSLFVFLLSNLHAAEIASNFLSMDDTKLAEIAIAKTPPRKFFGKIYPVTFEEACTDIDLKVYGNLFGKKKEKEVFEDICLLARASYPVWQIYLASLFYEGRAWLPINQELSFSFFQAACNNSIWSNEIYELDGFASDIFTHLKEAFSHETITVTQQLQKLILD